MCVYINVIQLEFIYSFNEYLFKILGGTTLLKYIVLLFFLFSGAYATYGRFQVRGRIGAAAAGL